MRSMPLVLEFDTSRIDRENGVLHDVVMVQEGEAKGHDVFLEAEFIEALVAYDQKFFSRNGVKARFGHPGASSETMGTQLGVFSNFRTRKKAGKMQAIADLTLLDAAELSPTHPGMKSWVLNMAQEQPDFIMSSIVFKGSGYYQRNADGSKEPMKIAYNEDGAYWKNYDSSKPLFVEFDTKKGAAHYYTDLVEAGAATESLFSTEANPHLFVSKALSWLDEHPELKSFAREHPEKVTAFLESLGVQPLKPKTLTMLSLKEILFGKDKPTESVELSAEQITELRTKLAAAETALAAAESRADAAEAKVKQLETAATDLSTQLKTAQDRVEELEQLAADTHQKTGDRKTESDDQGDVKSWMRDPINAAAGAFKTKK